MILTEAYTLDELREYVKSNLSGQVWRLEGIGEFPQVLDNAISDALMMYSRRVPLIDYQIIPANTSTYTFSPAIMGIMRVDFCDNSMFFSTTSVGLMQNMLGISSLQIASSGAGRLDSYLHWRRTFARVSNQRPDYIFRSDIQTVLIYNPASYTVCAIVFRPRTFDNVEMNHKEWLKNMTLAKATIQLGKIRNKFGGTIQGPGGTVITLDAKDLLSDGKKDEEKYEKELNDFQLRGLPQWD
jgi:hypothetical protein